MSVNSSSRIRVDAGTLRHLVDIERYVETQDAVGQPIKDWSNFATVHADVRQLTGREPFMAQERFSEANIMVITRYVPGITGTNVNTTMRIVWQGDVYNILDVSDVDGRKTRLEFICQTGLIEADQ